MSVKLLLICLLALAIVLSGCVGPGPVIDRCTKDAKVCPDGTTVGRNPALNCEFDPCPEVDKCNLAPEIGPCKAIITKYYFDKDSQTCKEFSWGGCKGVVPFDSIVVCQQNCDEACGSKGAFVNPEQLKGKTTYPDECCPGLKPMAAYMINNKNECEILKGTPFGVCMPCGDGICEGTKLENKCNCPEDCTTEIILWQLGIEPDGAPPHSFKQVTFSVMVTGTAAFKSLQLMESDSNGIALRKLGELKDDGISPDLTGGDSIYTGSFNIAAAEEGKQYYVAIANMGEKEYSSKLAALAITSFPIGPAPSGPNFLVADSETGQELYSNEVIVSFNEGVSEKRINEIVSDENASVVGAILSLGVYQLRIEGNGTVEGVKTAAKAFEAYKEVKYAEPNYVTNVN